MALVKEESRICFGLEWYDDEAEAWRRHEEIRKRGDTYNGGWYHGQPCGREEHFDFKPADGKPLYAVSIR